MLLAEAQAQSDVLRGEGEQEALRIVAEAFQRDMNFFQFWRSMQAYREAFSEGQTRMVMTPDSEFFRYFRESGGRPLPPFPGAAPASAPALVAPVAPVVPAPRAAPEAPATPAAPAGPATLQ